MEGWRFHGNHNNICTQVITNTIRLKGQSIFDWILSFLCTAPRMDLTSSPRKHYLHVDKITNNTSLLSFLHQMSLNTAGGYLYRQKKSPSLQRVLQKMFNIITINIHKPKESVWKAVADRGPGGATRCGQGAPPAAEGYV